MARTDALVWPQAALAAHMGQLEQLLLRSASAPRALDRLVGLDAPARGRAMVEACMSAVRQQPDMGRYIRCAGEALKVDKMSRQGTGELAGLPAMRAVQRGISVLVRTPSSMDSMDMAPGGNS